MRTSRVREKSSGLRKRDMMKLIMKGPEIVRARLITKSSRHSINLLGFSERSPVMSCLAVLSLIVLALRVFNLC